MERWAEGIRKHKLFGVAGAGSRQHRESGKMKLEFRALSLVHR